MGLLAKGLDCFGPISGSEPYGKQDDSFRARFGGQTSQPHDEGSFLEDPSADFGLLKPADEYRPLLDEYGFPLESGELHFRSEHPLAIHHRLINARFG